MSNSNDILDKLLVKPLPKKTQQFNISIEKPQEKIKTTQKFIDKRDENLVDPKEFIKKLGNIGIINKSEKGIKSQNIKELDKIKKIKKEIEKNNPFSNIKIINIRKTNKTFYITSLNDNPTSITDNINKKKKRFTLKPTSIDESYVLDYDLKINDIAIKDRIKNKYDDETIVLKASPYYLYNREIFITFINNLFDKFKDEILKEEKDLKEGHTTISCDNRSQKDFSLLIHQKIVKEYLNLYSPYRGLLLYHGLGSGKTCSSIAIAEGLKNNKQIIVFTPASLQRNYKDELKKCGDYLYKRKQYWEFINTENNPEYIKPLSNILKIPEEYIKKKGGAWLINIKKSPNYEDLGEHQQDINAQIDMMIAYKYSFINYNGLRNDSINYLTLNNTINPFTDKVVIIDEVHNFISRIVNKMKKPNSISIKLYHLLMEAENCKIILLSGTPIINYPNEIGIIYNILRGYIRTYNYKLLENDKNLDIQKLLKLFKEENIDNSIDDIQFNSVTQKLLITKNPFGFVNVNKKMEYSKDEITNAIEFDEKIKKVLLKNNIKFLNDKYNHEHIQNFKALPDDLEGFKFEFIDPNNKIKNKNKLMKRIIGLTSYFRSAQENLMPKLITNNNKDYQIVYIEMSNVQFGIYERARIDERSFQKNMNRKKNSKKNVTTEDIYSDEISTYRIFSRLFCNFIFPEKYIKRPMPKTNENIEEALNDMNEAFKDENLNLDNIIDDRKMEDDIKEEDSLIDNEDIELIKSKEKDIKDMSYAERMKNALNELEKGSNKFLTKEALKMYSPKFLNILENIEDKEFEGIHLIYSQFKTLEGIGIFKLILKENNFIEFKLKRNELKEIELDVKEEDYGKLMFAAYTGDETQEEKDIIKNVLNNNWLVVPTQILNKIKKIAPNNYYGNVIKLLMITSSGAEGINLENVRYVHITEPFWHPIRIEQVIGRAKRICSHHNLPENLRNVRVFLYIMKFSKEQIESDNSIELRRHDKSKLIDPETNDYAVHTTDQYLYEISMIKENINREILKCIKESAIDCILHSTTNKKENLKCFSIGNPNLEKYIYNPNLKEQLNDKAEELNMKKETLKLAELKGTKYVYNKVDLKVYYIDPENPNQEPIYKGYIKQINNKNVFIPFINEK